jgi:hypothetical protein
VYSYASVAGNGHATIGITTVPLGFNHFALTYDGANYTTYLNGALDQGPTPFAAVYNGGGFALGASSAGTSNWASGSMGGWGVWGRVLSATGIANLYNSGNGQAYSSLGSLAG